MDFEVINRAGLKQAHFAKIIGVSRVTVCKWMTGKVSPHLLHARRIEQLLAALELAVEDGDLPLPAGMETGAAIKRIKQIILDKVKKVKDVEKA